MRWLTLLVLMLGASASARMPGYTINEVWQQHVALDGQVIKVGGVVLRCQQLGCSLRENASTNARSLSLGGSDDFDRAIQSRLGLPVVIEGRLNSACLHARADKAFGEHGQQDVVICLDRAPELVDPRIVSSR